LFNEVFFDDVFVPDEMVVGTVDDGWRLARTTLANERVAMAQGTALGNPMEELLRSASDLDPADQDRLGALIVAAQVGSAGSADRAAGGQRCRPGSAGQCPQADRRAVPAGPVRIPDGTGTRRWIGGRRAGLRLPHTRCLTIAGGSEQILLTLAGERLLGLPR
jgi:hypothetical protein